MSCMGQPTAEQIMTALLALQDRVTEVRGDVHDNTQAVRELGPVLQAAMTAAVVDGMRTAMREAWRDPETWGAAMEGAQKRFQSDAGGWLFGGIKAIFSRVAWIVLIGVAVYLLGGWSALVALVKSGVTQP